MSYRTTVISALRIRDGHLCGICDEPLRDGGAIAIDHIVFRAHGGSDELDNLRLTHALCNSGRQPRPKRQPKQERDPLLDRKIREARHRAGLTQQQLARKVGVTRRAVSLWEAGSRTPGWHLMIRISNATGRPLAWFLVDEARA